MTDPFAATSDNQNPVDPFAAQEGQNASQVDPFAQENQGASQVDPFAAQDGGAPAPDPFAKPPDSAAPTKSAPGLAGMVQQYQKGAGAGGTGGLKNPLQSDAGTPDLLAPIEAGARFISGGLAPFQLPQDLLFAGLKAAEDTLNPGSLAAALSDHAQANGAPAGRVGLSNFLMGAVTQDFKRNFAGNESVLTHLLEYIPFQPFSAHGPVRNVSGAQLLQGVGVKNAAALRYGGTTADLILDPQLIFPLLEGFGWALKGAGALTSAAGAAEAGAKAMSSADKLRNAARAGEKLTSPFYLAGKATDAAITAGVKAVLPDRITEGMTSSFASVGKVIMNLPAGKVDPATGQPAYTIGDLLAPKSRALNAKLGSSFQRNAQGDITDVGVGGNIKLAARLGRQAAQEAQQTAVQGLKALHDLLGDGENKWWSGVLNSVRKQQKLGPTVNYIPDKTVRDTILNLTYEEVRGGENSSGIGLHVAGRNVTPAVKGFLRQAAPEMRPKTPLARTASQLQGSLTDVVGAEKQAAAEAGFAQKIDHVRKVAEAKGVNPDQAEAVLRQAVQTVQLSDAGVGMALSMAGPIGDNFLRATTKAGLSADEGGNLWIQALAKAGAGSQDIYKIDSFNVGGEEKALGDLLGRPGEKVTVGDLTGNEPTFAGLNLNAFAVGLQNGHLRRAYGMFYAPGDMQALVRAFKGGKIVPSNLIDEQNIGKYLGDRGYGAEGKVVQDYIQATTGASGAESGFLIRQSDLATALTQAGFKPARVKESLALVAQSAHGTEFESFLGNVKKAASGFTPPVRAVVGRGLGQSFLTSREDFIGKNVQVAQEALTKAAKKAAEKGAVNVDDPAVQASILQQARAMGEEEARKQLEALGELRDVRISLYQQAQHAMAAIPGQEYLARAYQIASDGGFVKRGAADDIAPIVDGTPFAFIGDSQANRNGVGAFAGTWIHPAILSDMHRALRTPAMRASSLQQLRSLATGGFLTGPPVTWQNLTSGILNTAQLGINPLLHAFYTATAWRDLGRAAAGVKIPDLELYKSIEPLRLTRMSEAAGLSEDMHGIAKKIAMGELNAPGALEGMTNAYRKFLNKPLGIPGMGLNLFQRSENAMRFGAFRAARAMGMSLEHAATAARYSVYDYSELPYILEGLRSTGLVLFPGFPYFMAGRLVDGAVRHPAVMAVSDRIPAAITNAVAGDHKYQVYASMPGYLQQDHGAPMFMTVDPTGALIAHVMPVGQMVPNNVFAGGPSGAITPFTDSIANAGIIGPLIDYVASWVNGGVPLFAQKYGGKVFEPGRSKDAQILQSLGFMYNSLAPSFARKAVSYKAGSGFTGWASDLARAAKHYIDRSSPPMPLGLAQSHYSLWEKMNKRPQKSFVDDVISALARSSTPIALSGPLANVRRAHSAAQKQLSLDRSTWANQYQKEQEAAQYAQEAGYPDVAKIHQQRMQEAIAAVRRLNQQFIDTWQPVIQTLTSPPTPDVNPAPAQNR